MSWSELLPTGPGTPPAVPLRYLVLAALAEAVIRRREGPGSCADCGPGRLCADHRSDLDMAGEFESAYMRVARIGGDGAVLTLIGGLA